MDNSLPDKENIATAFDKNRNGNATWMVLWVCEEEEIIRNWFPVAAAFTSGHSTDQMFRYLCIYIRVLICIYVYILYIYIYIYINIYIYELNNEHFEDSSLGQHCSLCKKIITLDILWPFHKASTKAEGFHFASLPTYVDL